jgi:hypothetical protein
VLVFLVSAVKICKIYSVSPHVTTCNSLWNVLKFFDKFHSYSHQTVMSTLYMQLETFYFSRLEGSSLYDIHNDTAVLMKNSFLWDVVPCILVSRY